MSNFVSEVKASCFSERNMVFEGIVNSVAHRDYTSSASVEIMLFTDRFEIWNPGTLPPSLTIASLSQPAAEVSFDEERN